EQADRPDDRQERRRAMERAEREGEQGQAAQDVDEAKELEARRGNEKLRVGGLEENEVERPLANVLDDVAQRRANGAVEDALQAGEPGHDDERLGPRPARDGGALVVEDDERDD